MTCFGKNKTMKPETAKRAKELFEKYKDVPPVFSQLIKEGFNVNYPNLVEFFDGTPIAKKLPLEELDRPRRKYKNYQAKKTRLKKTQEKNNQATTEEEPKVSNHKKIAKELHSAFTRILEIKAKEKGQIYEKALFFDTLTKRKYNFEKIVDVLNAYERREKKGLPFSTLEIAKESGTLELTVKRILSKMNLISEIKTKINENLHKAIENATLIQGISISDVAYFLGIQTKQLRRYIKESGLKPIKPGIYYGFSAASKVYEAQDAGFSYRETAEYSELNYKTVDYMLRNRHIEEKKIIEFLKKLYPDREITKPYL